MTKKHFIALADAIKFSHPRLGDTEGRETWRKLAESIADVCESANPRFDRSRFLNATVPAGLDDPSQWPK